MVKRYYEPFRKQLDEMMGPNRNGDKPQLIVQDFFDARVCKYDLVGLCPYKLFPNTKQDLGKCPFEVCPVPDKFKKQYEEAKTNGKEFSYERELEGFLERLVRECDDRVGKGKQRLEQQASSEPEEVKRIRLQIDEYTKQIERFVEENLIDSAQELMEKVDALKKEKEQFESKLPSAKEQQLLVCEVCAALLSVNESDQRLADHFAGKGHMGYQRIRDKLKQLREAHVAEMEKRYQQHQQHHQQQQQQQNNSLVNNMPQGSMQQMQSDRNTYRQNEQYRRDQEPRDRERKYSSRHHHDYHGSGSSSSGSRHRHRRDYSRSRSRSTERRRRRERSKS